MDEIYRFDSFELDPRTSELRRDGMVVPLQPQPAGILALLVSRAGQLVTREEIQGAIWPDRVVDYDQGLNYAIRQIRAVLGDDADDPRFVETLPRRGYRFVGSVERVSDAELIGHGRGRLVAYGLSGSLLAVVAVAAWAVLDGDASPRGERAALVSPAEESSLPVDPTARESFLIARRLLDTSDRAVLEQARREFEEALAREPDYAPALTGIGEALLRSGKAAEARAPLERALELNPRDAQAHHLLAQVFLFNDWRWEEAKRHLDESLRLRPEYPAAYQVQAYWHALNGRMEEARTSMRTALRLDPLSSYVHADAGWIDYWAGELDVAETRCARTLELDPGSGSGRTCLLFVRIEQGDQVAVREAARALMVAHEAGATDLTSFDLAPIGESLTRYWSWEAQRLEGLPERSAHEAFLLALAYAQLGREDDAFRQLDAARDGRTSWMLWLEVEPRLEPLRDDPRWAGVVGRMGFPRSPAG
ncbi:MAG TPA: tetratricopeptide repeat protein [Gemmatimonadota bacterium]|nr:tetratricopeptide repeat protein [Gemmatimonadota bacterium]